MSIPTTAVAPYQPVLSDVERMTMLGFLAAYRGFTRDAYTSDLRQFTTWYWQNQHQLFDVRRVDIECFARDLEDRGKARATVARRLCTVVGFYRYAEEEGVIAHSPAVHIRRPRIDYESHVAHLDRNELGAILVTAGLSSARDHALVSLLALNGLRVSEAIGANIEALGQERGHRTLTVLRKGGKLVTMPLAPRVARGIDLAVGERLEGPIFIDADGQRLDRHADRASHRPPRRGRKTGRTTHLASRLHHCRFGRRRAVA
jgi:integrase